MEEKRMQAQELMQNQVAPLYNEIYDTMRELMNENVREGDSLSSTLNIMGFIFLLIIVGVIVLAIIIATEDSWLNLPLVTAKNSFRSNAYSSVSPSISMPC